MTTVRRIGMTMALACALAGAAVPTLAQDKAPMPDEKAMMEAMMKAGTPGEQHKHLGMLAGSWTTVTKAWMQPGAPPMEEKGSSEVAMIMGGRYLQESYSGTFAGAPFTGQGLTGYDNTLKTYQATWIDSWSTQIAELTGTWDEATKSYTFTGMISDPMTGKEKAMKMVIKLVDANTRMSEFWDPMPDGKWVKAMEITYKRAGDHAHHH